MSAPAKRELWRLAAAAVVLAFLGTLLVLGSRPGGALPLWLYREGRIALALAALAVLALGVVSSFRRPPFLQAGRVRAFVALVLVIGVVNLPFPFPAPREGRPSAICFRLPFADEWRVFWGGDESATNRLAAHFADRRFGYDFVLERDGALFAGDGREAGDWYAFGAPVLAPAAGEVVAVRDDFPDVPPGTRAAGRDALHGNHVVLRVADGEYACLGNLRRGSITVGIGRTVRVGEPIGVVGNSGANPLTPFPHLAFHLQDAATSATGAGVPLRFCGYALAGESAPRDGSPRGGIDSGGRPSGERVRPLAPPDSLSGDD